MIKLQAISKYYGPVAAIKDINLHIQKGEFAFLVGPSGAGKSTIMRLLYREELPTTGNVYVGRIDVSRIRKSEIPHLRRRMGIVFQDFKLLSKQSCFDNVAYVIRALGMSPSEVEKRVLMALKVVGLLDKRKSTPEELSGGEQQRVGIARAIVNGPPLLIADEPTGNLDPETSSDIMTLLDQINQRGITVLVSTHDKIIVNQMRKRVIYLDGGKIVSDMYDGTYDFE
ncbi:MAG: cell division ATP-binding protein FtsE [Cyanobacteriota bacterium]